jgi:hypothetical protein
LFWLKRDWELRSNNNGTVSFAYDLCYLLYLQFMCLFSFIWFIRGMNQISLQFLVGLINWRHQQWQWWLWNCEIVYSFKFEIVKCLISFLFNFFLLTNVIRIVDCVKYSLVLFFLYNGDETQNFVHITQTTHH